MMLAPPDDNRIFPLSGHGHGQTYTLYTLAYFQSTSFTEGLTSVYRVMQYSGFLWKTQTGSGAKRRNCTAVKLIYAAMNWNNGVKL